MIELNLTITVVSLAAYTKISHIINFHSATSFLHLHPIITNNIIFSELIDTFFIVVHKKPLIFLHWYHHVTVLLYCWTSYLNHIPAGFIFAAMNFSVHSIMYGYYFLMAMKIKPKWFSAIYITLAQIFQMVLGVLITSLNFYYFLSDSSGTCNLGWISLFAGFSMYGSYLFLFLQFFLGRYNFVGGANKKDKLKFF